MQYDEERSAFLVYDEFLAQRHFVIITHVVEERRSTKITLNITKHVEGLGSLSLFQNGPQ